MKLNKIMMNSVGVVTALIAGSAMAGDVGPITGDSITVQAPASGGGAGILAGSGIGGTLSAGYDSTYIFRGHDVGRAEGRNSDTNHMVWSSLDLEKELGGGVTLSTGAWYASFAESAFTELDLYAKLTKDLGFATAGVGYTYYWFGQNGGYTQEVGASLSREFGPVKLGVDYFYDLEEVNNGSYAQFAAEYSKGLSDNVAFQLRASVAYGFDYYVLGDDWYDVNVRAGLPIKLTENATLTPYIAVSIPLDGAEAFNGSDREIVYGGAAISVSF